MTRKNLSRRIIIHLPDGNNYDFHQSENVSDDIMEDLRIKISKADSMEMKVYFGLYTDVVEKTGKIHLWGDVLKNCYITVEPA